MTGPAENIETSANQERAPLAYHQASSSDWNIVTSRQRQTTGRPDRSPGLGRSATSRNIPHRRAQQRIEPRR